MIRLSVPVRQALARLTLPVLFAVSFAVVLLGRVDALVADRARISLADALAPIYATLSGPLSAVRAGVSNLTDLASLGAETARLRLENARLLHWQAVALALASENRALKAQLHWVPTPAPSFVTARVVADAGGVYAKAVLLSVGPNHFIHTGQIALDRGGLVGRVVDVGTRSARVLLITDLNSRIPVVLESSRARAILVGTNGPLPKLIYWSGGAPREGERVVTAGQAGAFPPDLPVGMVHYSAQHVPEVVPAADLGRLEIVRIVDAGAAGVPAPEAQSVPSPGAQNGTTPAAPTGTPPQPTSSLPQGG